MALNKNIQCIPCINKNNPSQGKTFYKMESLELSTRFVTDSEHKQSINQTLSLASRDYFYAKNYLSYTPYKKSHSTDHKSILPIYSNNSPRHTTKSIFDKYTLLNIENHI